MIHSPVAPTKRYLLLDAIRGVAILLMVIYHIVVMLSLFFFQNLNFQSWGWWLVGKTSSHLFLLLAGISLWISYQRKQRVNWSDWQINHHLWRRGAALVCCGLLITLVTRIAVPDWTIYFGILHLMGVSTLLSPVVLKRNGMILPLSLSLGLA